MNTNPVPWIRSGTGSTPADGGCIMQVVDWISSGGWTDQPECVHPVFRKVAIHLNDSLDDQGRQRLLDLTGRLMGTNDGRKETSVALAVFCARRVLPVFEERFPQDGRPRAAVEAAEAWLADPSEGNRKAAYSAYSAYSANAANAAYSVYAAYAANTAYAAYSANAANAAANAANSVNAAYAAYAAAVSFDLLTDLLDEYDRITGRTTVEQPDFAGVCAVMSAPDQEGNTA